MTSAHDSTRRKVMAALAALPLGAMAAGSSQAGEMRRVGSRVIATEVGYGSEVALSHAFKAQFGQSPRKWKAASLAAAKA